MALSLANPLFSQVENKDYTLVWHSADNNILPQNSVKSIIEDNNGFVWLATENGLVRYDGNQFKIFNIENVEGMTTNRMAVFRGNASKDKIYLLNDLSEYILIKNNEVSIIPKNKIPKQFKISTNLYKNRRFYNNKIYRTDNTYYSISSKHIDLYDDQNQSLWQIKYDFNESQNFFILDNILYNYDGEKI